MKTISSVLLVFCAIMCFVHSYEVYEDEDGTAFYLVPLIRQRRQTSVDIRKDGPGTRVTLGHSGTIYENDRHQVTGGAFASKPFRPSGPATVGGNVNYNHLPSGSGIGVNAAKTPRFGTDLGVQGNANLWRKGNSRLDAVGSYQRHFGGQFGTGKPQAYAGLNFNHQF